jgi:hypothetical protein
MAAGRVEPALEQNGAKTLDSGFRRNDEQMNARKRHHPHPTLPLKGRAKDGSQGE